MTRHSDVRPRNHVGDLTTSEDKKTAENDAFEALKLRLYDAFSIADSEYELVSVEDMRRRLGGVEL